LDLKEHATHPVFAAATITSYTSILETDYNLHKSNSTYFADMDISRTTCATPLYTPGAGIVSKELDEEIAAAVVAEGKPRPKKKLPMYIALGGTYCTFKREIKPLEKFTLKSQVVAWDEKWMYIVTYFLKAEKKKGEGPILAAIGLSKYCLKKGRLTVPIERVLRASGYLPARPDGSAVPIPALAALSSKDISSTATPQTQDGLTETTLDEVKLVEEVSKLGEHAPEVLQKQQKENAAAWTEEEWSWERIEEQRKKGLEIVHGFISLDNMLYEGWKSG
jgi:Thioesterase-like superfamily